MLLLLLLIIPLIGTILVSISSETAPSLSNALASDNPTTESALNKDITTPLHSDEPTKVGSSGGLHLNALTKNNAPKLIGLLTSIVNLFVSIIVFLLFNFSSNQYQFVQEYHSVGPMASSIDFYLGVDGISMYFVLLTTIIMPIAILSN
ncbi:MAG: hypothetical protein EOP34_07805 [Rickettsiales bacterium]|nr:MAG: hypothetical protein EOP34_07805 [Rickettsiales bacterium]